MPDFGIYAGDTSKTVYVRLRDSTTGLAKTGLLFDSAGAVASYVLPGAARVAITLATLASASAAWATGGFILVDDTNAKGLYRLDLPDAAIASGAFTVITIEFDGIIEEAMVIPLHTPKVNVVEISGDAAAADNLELMYDGTGYTDETGPSSRSQVDNIGAASGAALSYEASADNTSGAIIDGVTIVGSITANLFTETDVEDGVRHQLTHSGNAFDFVYKLPIGGGRIAADVEWKGYLTSSNDACSIQAYDHVGAAWDTVATINGTNGTANATHIAALLSKHTGTGAELGNVYIRFICTGQTSPVLNTDLLLIQAVNIGQSVGYAGGQIWINTGASNTNTEAFVDGVADKPVSTIAAAKTLSTAVGLGDFHIINGSTITLAESTANESYFGDNWTLVLNGQTVTGAHFEGADVSGTQVGACEFRRCEIGTITTIAETHFENCGMNGTITLPTGNVYIESCHHEGAFVLDFGAAVGSTTVHVHKYAGEIELQNIGDSGTDIVHLDGKGKLTINANCSGGTVHLRGEWLIADSAGGAVTITRDDPATSIIAIEVDTGTTIPALLPSALVGGRMDSDIGAKTGNVALSAQEKLDVNTEADTALTDYDPPTKAEMDTAHGLLATEAKQDIIDTVVDAIKVVTDAIGATGTGLSAIPWNSAWDAEIESEVNDALDTAIAELGVGAPTATPTLRTGLMLIYMKLAQKFSTQTSGTDALEIYNAAGTLIAKKLITDDGADYIEAKAVSG